MEFDYINDISLKKDNNFSEENNHTSEVIQLLEFNNPPNHLNIFSVPFEEMDTHNAI